MSRSRWAPPRLSARFIPIYRRHFLVWRKQALVSLLANIGDPLLTLVAFGYGLGMMLPKIEGVDYITFLAAGSLAMSAMMAASFESLYSAFARMQIQRTWESMLNAPLELDDVLLTEWLWAATKSLMSAIAIVSVIVVLGISRAPSVVLAIPLAVLIGLCFGALGLCWTVLARGYDFFTYFFTVVTPMVFISGVYFPQTNIPAWLAAVGRLLPLAPAVELARPLVLGQWPDTWLRPLATLLVYTVGGYWLAVVLARRRFLA